IITLTGLEAPLEMAGCVLPIPGGGGLAGALEEARGVAGDFLALDAPEWLQSHGLVAADAVAFARELELGLRATHLRALLNLNCAPPPPWAEELAEGPLFAEHRRPPAPERLSESAEALREQFLAREPDTALVRIDWHLDERDFSPSALPDLTRLARRALDG